MQVQRISSSDELVALRHHWNDLAGHVPFRQWEWMHSWWTAYSAGRDLYVLVARDEDRQVVGIAPLYREHNLTSGRVLQLLGNGKACSEYQSLLVRPHEIDRVSLAFARWLAAASAMKEHGWDQCDLESVAEGDLAVLALSRQLTKFEVLTTVRPDPPCWCLDLPLRWNELLAGVKKSVRRKLRTLERRYIESGRAVCRVAETETEIACDFDHLVDLHERRWYQVGRLGCFSHFGFERFLYDAVQEFSRTGQARFHRLELDGNVVAVSFALIRGDRHFIYQCGIEPRKMEHQPGWLLNMMTLKQLIDAGVRQCDFLRGDERYKRELGARPKPQVQVRLGAPHTRGRLHHQLWMTQDTLRNWGQQVATAFRT